MGTSSERKFCVGSHLKEYTQKDQVDPAKNHKAVELGV